MSRTTVYLVDGEEVEGAKAAARILHCAPGELTRPLWSKIDGEVTYRGHTVERVGPKTEYYLDGKSATIGECAKALGYATESGAYWATRDSEDGTVARNGHVVRRVVW